MRHVFRRERVSAVLTADWTEEGIAAFISGGQTPSQVLCALYNQYGKMLRAVQQDVIIGETIPYILFDDDADLVGAEYGKVFLLSPQGEPFCECVNVSPEETDTAEAETE